MNVSDPVVFVGFEGMDPRWIRHWAADGKLPAFADLLSRSATVHVRAEPGFSNGSTWPSIYMGAHPAKHGRYFSRQIALGEYRLHTFHEDRDYRRQPIWHFLTESGKRAILIDVVKAPLARNLNGIQLVDWLVHDRAGSTRSWPPDVARDVLEKFGADPFKGRTDTTTARNDDDFRYLCAELKKRVRSKAAFVAELLGKRDFSLFMTVFQEAHDIGHLCWHIHDRHHPQHSRELAERLQDPVLEVYRELDDALESVLEAAPGDAPLLVFAGSGMEPNYTANHLLEHVLMRVERGMAAPSTSERLERAYRSLVPRALRTALWPIARKSKDLAVDAGRARRMFYAVPHNENSGAVRLNVIGREPRGRIHPGREYEDVCRHLTEELLELRNGDTGEPIVREVSRVSGFDGGANAHALPDLLVVWNRSSPITRIVSPQLGVVEGTYPGQRTGDHTPDYELWVHREGLKSFTLERPVSAMDIGATLARMLGVELPQADGVAVDALL